MPADRAEAIRICSNISAEKKHRVITGVALLMGSRKVNGSATTRVSFRKLTASEMQWYVRTGEPYGQGRAYGSRGWRGFSSPELTVAISTWSDSL